MCFTTFYYAILQNIPYQSKWKFCNGMLSDVLFLCAGLCYVMLCVTSCAGLLMLCSNSTCCLNFSIYSTSNASLGSFISVPSCLVFSICSRKFVAHLWPLAMVVTASLRTQSARPKPKSVRSPVKRERERESLFLSFTFKKREEEKRVYMRYFGVALRVAFGHCHCWTVEDSGPFSAPG